SASLAGSRTEHLAGRWAAKEAFIKAWSQAIYGNPPVIEPDLVNFAEIEVSPDRRGRVALQVKGEVAAKVQESIGDVELSLSISQDGDYANAQCLMRYQRWSIKDMKGLPGSREGPFGVQVLLLRCCVEPLRTLQITPYCKGIAE